MKPLISSLSLHSHEQRPSLETGDDGRMRVKPDPQAPPPAGGRPGRPGPQTLPSKACLLLCHHPLPTACTYHWREPSGALQEVGSGGGSHLPLECLFGGWNACPLSPHAFQPIHVFLCLLSPFNILPLSPLPCKWHDMPICCVLSPSSFLYSLCSKLCILCPLPQNPTHTCKGERQGKALSLGTGSQEFLCVCMFLCICPTHRFFCHCWQVSGEVGTVGSKHKNNGHCELWDRTCGLLQQVRLWILWVA